LASFENTYVQRPLLKLCLSGCAVSCLSQGSFLRPGGAPSAVLALPTRQLLAHTKVVVPAGSSEAVTLTFNITEIAGALRQAWPGVLACWVGDGFGGAVSGHIGSPGEGAQPAFANLSLVLPMVQEPSDCTAC
jgi:hypothetical protein